MSHGVDARANEQLWTESRYLDGVPADGDRAFGPFCVRARTPAPFPDPFEHALDQADRVAGGLAR